MCAYPRIAISLSCSVCLLGGVTPMKAQQMPAAGSAVQPAAFNRSALAAQPQQAVRFGRQAVSVGDQAEQTVAVESRLTLTMRRGNELFGKNQSTVQSNQRRIITTTEVHGGITTGATISYPVATRQIVAAGQPDEGSPATSPSQSESTTNAAENVTQTEEQPVQGKKYDCEREPGEGGSLIIMDEKGSRPPAEEYEIVAAHMEMIGRPNPLAKFLAGRSVAVGEKLEVPNELAGQILNLGKKFGQVTHFTLTLQKVRSEEGGETAMFLADVEAASIDASQMRLQMAGPLEVRVASCRATRLDLSGPIGFSETRGSYSTAHQVIGTGRLHVNIASAYRAAQR